jgi:hypothetical protein
MTCLAFPIEQRWFSWLEREGRQLVAGRSNVDSYARYLELLPALQRAVLDSLPDFPGFDFLDEAPEECVKIVLANDEEEEEEEQPWEGERAEDDAEEREGERGEEAETIKKPLTKIHYGESRRDAILRYLRDSVAVIKERNLLPNRVLGSHKVARQSRGRRLLIEEMLQQRVLRQGEGTSGYFVQSKRWPTLEDILRAVESGEIKVD